MGLNIKTIEMVAKIQSRRKPHVRLSCDVLFADYIPTMDDCLREMHVYIKKRQKELKEENKEYRN